MVALKPSAAVIISVHFTEEVLPSSVHTPPPPLFFVFVFVTNVGYYMYVCSLRVAIQLSQ